MNEERVYKWAQGILRDSKRAAVNPLRVRNAVIAILLIRSGLSRNRIRMMCCWEVYDPMVDHHIREMILIWFGCKLVLGEPTSADSPVFAGRQGRFLSPKDFRRIEAEIQVMTKREKRR